MKLITTEILLTVYNTKDTHTHTYIQHTHIHFIERDTQFGLDMYMAPSFTRQLL